MVSRNFPLRLLVGSDMVGAIIGRSGATIRTITVQTKARIDVHREESPEQSEKVVTITGTPESCSDACFKIVEIIQNEKSIQNNNFASINSDITLKILAPSTLIGRLIGRNGTSIKKMMEQTSTKISISVNNLTESTGEHTITVIGRLEQVRQAEKLISFKLRSAYTSDMQNSLQTMSHQPYLFNNIPLPYVSGPYAQNSILSSLVNSPSSSGGSAMSRNLPLSSHQGQLPASLYSGAPGYLPLYPNINVPTTPGLLGFNPLVPGFDYERETVFIYIPATMVGAIIGKSGTAIKEMISTSGASIKVATVPPPGSTEASNQNETRNDESNNVRSDVSAKPTTATTNPPSNSESTVEEQSSQLSANNELPKHSNVSSNENQLATRRVTIVGYPTSQYSAQYMIYRKIAAESGKSDISLMVEIQVPSLLVGRIIGKAGTAVKQLQKQTRTMIRLPEDKSVQQSVNPDGSETDFQTTVQISGEFEGSQAAQRHIRNLIRDSAQSRQNKSHQNRNNESNQAKNTNAHTNSFASTDHQNENGMASQNNFERKSEDMNHEKDSACESRTRETKSTSCGCYQSRTQELGGVEGEHSPQGHSTNGDLNADLDDTDGIISNNNTINSNLNNNNNKLSMNQLSVNKLRDHQNMDIENGETTLHVHNQGPP